MYHVKICTAVRTAERMREMGIYDVQKFDELVKGNSYVGRGIVVGKSEDGKKQHLFFHPVGGGTDWVLMNIVDDNEVFGTLRHVRQFLLLPVMAGLLLIGFIIYRSKRNLERLRQLNAEKERIDSELRVANGIQQSMLPKEAVRDEGLVVRGFLKPAREVGGDLYDYFVYDEQLFFCIGDVSGKGVPASLFMAQATRLFLTLAKQAMSPAEICTRMNDALSGNDNETNMFVTFWLGLVDLTTGHLTFCNAGHNPPVIGCGGDDVALMDMIPNAPIGILPGMEYVNEEVETIKGRPLFIYTDGLNEAENKENEQFSDERLLEILRNTHFTSAQQIIESLSQEVEAHRQGAEPNDDLTMMCLLCL